MTGLARFRFGPSPLSIARQLPLPPMMLFARRFEHLPDVTVQRPHNPDPRQHRRAATFGDQQQRFRRGLPLRRLVLGLR
jgi:hypothetical protein